MSSHELFNLKTYPYGYRGWLNNVWQECRRRGIVPEDTTPVDTRLDPDGWLAYFMEGLHPFKAVQADLNEQP